MKVHTTNYLDTLIQVADDCPATQGEIPPQKGAQRSVALIQFELLMQHPYMFSSDDLLFRTYAERQEIPPGEWKQAREAFFAKGQPCLRASPLTKRYGWGVHCDHEGKIALYGCDTETYRRLSGDPDIKVVKAMKSSR